MKRQVIKDGVKWDRSYLNRETTLEPLFGAYTRIRLCERTK